MTLTHQEVIDHIQAYVRKNKLKAALDFLYKYYKNDPEPQQAITLLSGQLVAIQSREANGGIDINTSTRFYNNLRERLLVIVQTHTANSSIPDTEIAKFLKQDQPFKRVIVRSVIIRLLHDHQQGLCVAELIQLARFERSGYKRLFRKLVVQSLEELKTAEIVTTNRENKLTCYRLTAKGLQVLEGFKETIFLKEKEG